MWMADAHYRKKSTSRFLAVDRTPDPAARGQNLESRGGESRGTWSGASTAVDDEDLPRVVGLFGEGLESSRGDCRLGPVHLPDTLREEENPMASSYGCRPGDSGRFPAGSTASGGGEHPCREPFGPDEGAVGSGQGGAEEIRG